MKISNKQRVAGRLMFVAKFAGFPFAWLANRINPPPPSFREISSLEIKGNQFTAEMKIDGIQALATNISDTFFQAGGYNYVTMEMYSPSLGMFEVIIQRKSNGGKSPADMVIELRRALVDVSDRCFCGVTEGYEHLLTVTPYKGFNDDGSPRE